MRPKIVAFGEVIWDVYENDRCLGGAGLNFAAHCARCGAESFLYSAVGKDDLGDAMLAAARRWGVDISFVGRSDRKTGQSLVSLDDNGVPTFDVLKDVAYDNVTVSDGDIARLRAVAPDALYFGTIVRRAPVSRAALDIIRENVSFRETVCDVNLRKGCYDTENARFCLRNATVLKVSDEEEPLLRQMGLYEADGTPEDIARAIRETYPNVRILAFTCGGKGAYAFDLKGKKTYFEPAKKVRPASTVGAGDSFIAAFLTAYLAGESIGTALKRAVALSAFVVSKTEAIPEYTEAIFDERAL